MHIHKLLPHYLKDDEKPIPFTEEEQKQKGYGFTYKQKEYVPFSYLDPKKSAIYSLSLSQKRKLSFVGLLVVLSFLVNWHLTLVVLIGLITLVYFADLLSSFLLITKGFSNETELTVSQDELATLHHSNLPSFTIFCPLYKEKEVLSQFVLAMEQLDYPKDKLQILLLLEEDDPETINAAYQLGLPPHFEIVVVPHSFPKTKPKACNFGLLKATGDYCVIYDAEDIPEEDQLKKVAYSFTRVDSSIGCIQAKLNFYNPTQNLLTRLFTLEYSLWFDLILTGLQSVNAPIPLGGTSNHFRKSVLQQMGGWDAFNVTEDCDLGMRLSKAGYKTAILDSTTYEEANSDLKNWVNQRTRWIKGYIQTLLVHMRDMKSFWVSGNKTHLPWFLIIVGGKVLSLYINPLMWIITISYFTFKSFAGGFIESLYPSMIFYMAILSLTVGNFIYLYNYMIGCAKRGRYDLIKYALFVPFYWLMMSFASWIALYRLITKPYHWSKTVHGLHLAKKNNETRSSLKPVIEPTFVS